MSKAGQNFYIYRGDAQEPVFTIYDAAGAALDLSQLTDIQWIAYRLAAQSPPSLSKKKSTGGLALVTPPGTDGKVKVILNNADSNSLEFGWYFHSVIITDNLGNNTTVSVGRMAVLNRGQLT